METSSETADSTPCLPVYSAAWTGLGEANEASRVSALRLQSLLDADPALAQFRESVSP